MELVSVKPVQVYVIAEQYIDQLSKAGKKVIILNQSIKEIL